MPILAVSREEDPRIADYRNVPDATLLEQRGLFVAEGRIVVGRLLAGSRFRTRSVMVTDAALAAMPALSRQSDDVPVYVVPQELMNGVAGFNIHRGCLAIGERGAELAPAILAQQARRLVVLERVANADNVGGVFRNAAAFGVGGVVVDPVTTDPLYRKAIRTSVGTALQVPFARAQAWPGTLEALRDAGFVLLALTPAADAQPIDQAAADLAATKIALLLGHEGEGLSAEAITQCDVRARIPMAHGVDSLNVATAAAIALYEIAQMFDIVGFGENSIDSVLTVPALPGGMSTKLPVTSRTLLPGGQVATTMAACAALGMRTRYIGAFGNDEGGREVRAQLAARGIDLQHAMVRDAPNRYASILVDPRGERVVLWGRDERLVVRPAEVHADWIAGARALHVDAVDEEASIALATLGRAAGIPVTSDIDAVTPRTPALLAAVTVPILAEPIPALLTGECDPERGLRALRATHEGLLVVTLGERGAMLLDGQHLHHEPAFGVDAVDTTGAGDVFRAAFICGLLRGLHGGDLLRFANAAAAISCTRAGAMTAVPTLQEVDRLLAR